VNDISRGDRHVGRYNFTVKGIKNMANWIKFQVIAGAALSLLIGYGQAVAQSLPSVVGRCVLTTIAHVGQRLEDGSTGQSIPGSGSDVSFTGFAYGGHQVSYEEIPEITRSHKGDKVYVCLMLIPTGCPPGDERGRGYTTTNLRTMESWTLPDSEHGCGGA
jgi:hypothetical protein